MVDREMADAYLIALEAVSPEDAERMAAAYETLTPGDHEEWAAMMVELLEENGIEV